MSVVGIDAGTSRVKAVRFDAHWREVDVAVESTATSRDAAGRSEQDMAAVWAAVARVTGQVIRRAPDPIDFVAVTAQGDGCWLVDAEGEPAGPAMLWNDSRAGPVVARWAAGGVLDEAFTISGCYGAPGLANAQLRWLADTGDRTLDRAATLLSAGSWLYSRLTGRRVLDVSDAANPFLDAQDGEYSPALLELFEFGPLRRLLPPVVAGADRVGRLLPDVAAGLGLPGGTPVVLAPYDVVATSVGAGAVEPGAAYAVLGTTLCIATVTGEPDLARPPNGMTLPLERRHTWLTAFATMTGTEVLDWTARLLGLPDAAAVTGLAAAADRAHVPLMVPYLSPAGERSPFLDPGARGSLHGLDLGHTPADIARAAVDGLSLVVRDCADAAGGVGSLVVCGGGARSDLWCATIAAALGVRVVRSDVTEVGARGAVLTAAVELGQFARLPDTLAVVDTGTVFEPDPAEVERFDAASARLRAAGGHQRLTR